MARRRGRPVERRNDGAGGPDPHAARRETPEQARARLLARMRDAIRMVIIPQILGTSADPLPPPSRAAPRRH